MKESIGRRRRDVLLIVVGALIATALFTPAGAHVGGTPAHLWNKHLAPMAKKLFYSKAQANARYLPKSDAAKFLRRPTGTGTYHVNGATWIDGDSGHLAGPVSLGGNSMTSCSQTGGGAAYQQVYLPQDAMITGVRAQYQDSATGTGSNGTVWLSRSDIVGTGGAYTADSVSLDLPNDDVANVASVSPGTVFPDPDIVTVDNTKYSYVLQASLIAEAAICTVTVSYTQPPAPTTGAATT
jgi:hypothetical protein